MRSPFRIVLIACLVFTGVLILAFGIYISTPVTRHLDEAPISATSQENVLPAGQAQVSFEIDTSGDQMSLRKWQAGLGFIVHYGNTFQHQLLASCNDLGILGPSHSSLPMEAEADCDGQLYRFSVAGSELKVIKEVDTGKQIITYVNLPVNTQSITYSQDLWMQFPIEAR